MVKYSLEVKILEAKNMEFVTQHTAIRLPIVLNAWVDSRAGEEDTCYIMVTYIESSLLNEVWSGLNDIERLNI